jgi:hypothetical protein
VLRSLQRQAIETRLRRLVPRFLQRPCADREYARILQCHGDLCASELRLVMPTGDRPRSPHRTFDAVVGWTWHFIPGLLRELALAEIDVEWLAAEESPHAAVSFARGENERQPRAVCIRLAGFERSSRMPALIGAYRRVIYWSLGEQDVPWRQKRDGACPAAKDLWWWALGSVPADVRHGEAALFLEGRP